MSGLMERRSGGLEAEDGAYAARRKLLYREVLGELQGRLRDLRQSLRCG